MNYMEYQIGNFMIEKIMKHRGAAWLDSQFRPEDTNYRVSRMLMETLECLSNKITDKDVLEGIYANLRDLRNASQLCLQMSDFTTVSSGEDCLRNYVLLSRCMKDARNFCAKVVLEDWKSYLTPCDFIETSCRVGKSVEDFALLVRAIHANCYSRQADYPIISTSLFTPDHDRLYQDRQVALVFIPEPEQLLAMHSVDASTCATTTEFCEMSYEIPFMVERHEVVHSMYDVPLFDTFDGYKNRLRPDDTGEVLCKSSAKPVGILFTSKASAQEKVFAKSYATVFDLPLLCYNCEEKAFVQPTLN